MATNWSRSSRSRCGRTVTDSHSESGSRATRGGPWADGIRIRQLRQGLPYLGTVGRRRHASASIGASRCRLFAEAHHDRDGARSDDRGAGSVAGSQRFRCRGGRPRHRARVRRRAESAGRGPEHSVLHRRRRALPPRRLRDLDHRPRPAPAPDGADDRGRRRARDRRRPDAGAHPEPARRTRPIGGLVGSSLGRRDRHLRVRGHRCRKLRVVLAVRRRPRCCSCLRHRLHARGAEPGVPRPRRRRGQRLALCPHPSHRAARPGHARRLPLLGGRLGRRARPGRVLAGAAVRAGRGLCWPRSAHRA